MPFTFCHPAIVLPLAKVSKNKLSLTALIMGSMAPDFEYFIRMRMYREHSHSLGGLFYFELPITILLCILYHAFVRDSLINALPEIYRKRFESFTNLDWFGWAKKYWYVLIYSAIVGILSHIFWDAFTHEHGFFAERIPFLQQNTLIANSPIPNYHIAQLLSSIFGGLFILTAISIPLFPTIQYSILFEKVKYWGMVFLIMMLTLIMRGVQSFSDIIATSIAGWLLGLILAPIFLKLIPLKNERTEV
jgi:small-conductance mechanosensitive channel